jgi:hypothetical protein
VDLRDIIDEIGIDLDHDPSTVPKVRDARARIANRHYIQNSQQYPWIFLEKEATLSIAGSFTPTGTETASFVLNGYQVTPGGGLTAVAAWAGQTLVAPGAVEYMIATVNTGTNVFFLTTPYLGATGSSAAWTVRYDNVFLPVDCANALGFTDRTRNYIRLVTLGRRTEEFANLDRTASGDALVMVQNDSIQDRAPDFAPTLAQDATVGGLTTGTIYQYCTTFWYRGFESAPSPVAEITVTGTSVAITGLENTQIGGLNTGRYKYVYRRNKTRNGRWQRLTDLFTETEGVAVALVDIATGDFLATQNELFESQPVQAYRAWMRPAANGTAQTIYLRYMRKVRRMYADTDAPLWPPEYHHLICYLAEVDLYMQNGATDWANARRVDADALLARMKEQYLSTPDERHVRGSWADNYRGGIGFSQTITSDFSG